ncbi:MAG: cobalamin-dependent protein [Pseudomonadota bacterium]
MTQQTERLIETFANMEEQEALRIAEAMLEAGTDPMEVVESCKKALEIVGKQFEAGEMFIPELIMAGEMMETISEMVKPRMHGRAVEKKTLGKVVLGTVEGDVHDIGKNMVRFLMEIQGIEVIDLGVDVKPARFVECISETGATVVALSALLTLAFDSMKKTIDVIRKSEVGGRVKIIIGGAPVNEQICTFSGADAWGRDAVQGANLAKAWLAGGE